jgi:hypothetical protein
VTTRPTTDSGAPAGFYCGAMDRKIVTGPLWMRSGPPPFHTDTAPMSGSGVEPGRRNTPTGP